MEKMGGGLDLDMQIDSQSNGCFCCGIALTDINSMLLTVSYQYKHMAQHVTLTSLVTRDDKVCISAQMS
jgi:hypothetical protein